MSVKRPKFIDSPYFVMEENNWYIKDDAPEDVKKEFNEFMEYYRKMEEQGVNI